MNNNLRVADTDVLGKNQFTFIKRKKIRIIKPIFVCIHFLKINDNEFI